VGAGHHLAAFSPPRERGNPMSVVVSVEDVGPCRKQLKISVPAAALAAETERVIKSFAKDARLPGFRKGKVPPSLVRSRFKQEIEQELVDRLVPRYWRQAEAEQKLDPLLPPELGEVDLRMDEEMVFTAIVETRPEIKLGDYREFRLPDPIVEPADDDIDKQLADLQRRVAPWKAVERTAGRGDRVTAEVTEEGNEPQKAVFEIGDERVWEELGLAATGLSAGQSSTFRRRPQEGAEAKEYKVKVEVVEEQELPALDDDFAKVVSRFATVGELRVAVAESLRSAGRRERRRQREGALLQQLRERHPLTLPEGVVQQETESMVREYAHQLAHQGVDLDKAQIDWGALAEQVRPEAERVVHAGLLLDAVAEAEAIVVPEEQLEGLLAEIARDRKTSALAVRRELDHNGRLQRLRRQLRRQRTVARLLGEEEADATVDVHSHEDHDHDHG
jgi:trigger factor